MHTNPNFPVGLNSINQALIEMQQQQKQFHDENIQRMKQIQKKMDDAFDKLINSLLEDPDSMGTSDIQSDEVDTEIIVEEDIMEEYEELQTVDYLHFERSRELQTEENGSIVQSEPADSQISLDEAKVMVTKLNVKGILLNSPTLVASAGDAYVDSCLLPPIHGSKILELLCTPAVWKNVPVNLPSNYSEKTLENFCTSGVCINAPMNMSSQLTASLRLSCTSRNFTGLKGVDSIQVGLDKPPPLRPQIAYGFASINLGLPINSMLGMSLLSYSCTSFKGLATLVVPIKHKIGKDVVIEKKCVLQPFIPVLAIDEVLFSSEYIDPSVDKMDVWPLCSHGLKSALRLCMLDVCNNAPVNFYSFGANFRSLMKHQNGLCKLGAPLRLTWLGKPPPWPPDIYMNIATSRATDGAMILKQMGVVMLVEKQFVVHSASLVQTLASKSNVKIIAIITMKEALLWTDGTYSLQATEQLSKQWKLMCLGEDTPVGTWMADNLPEGAIIGVDQWCVSVDTARKWEHAFSRKKQKLINTPNNLVDEILSNRLPAAINPVVIHPVEFAEKSVTDKIMDLRGRLAQENASGIIATTLGEVDWLYSKMSSEANSFMNENGMEVRKYEAVSSDVVLLSSGRLEGSLSATKEAHGKYLEDVQSDLTKNGEVNGSNKVAGNQILIWVDPGSGCYALYSKWDFRIGYYGVGGVRRQLIQIQERTLSLFNEFLMSDSQIEPLTYGDNNYEGSIDNMNMKDKITNLKIIIICCLLFLCDGNCCHHEDQVHLSSRGLEFYRIRDGKTVDLEDKVIFEAPRNVAREKYLVT
uniref:Creatinase N-terminal domain-containing protein n=1 Tax=Kalanchoe fedtschenkoi TaxID=63787 RepID=A0A7N0URY9_KALFE